MSTLSGWRLANPLRERPRAQAVLSVLAICVGAVVAGMIGIMTVGLTIPSTAFDDTAAYGVVDGHFIQLGFAAFAAIYLYRADDWRRYVKVRRPTLEDLAWIVAIPVLFQAVPLLKLLLSTLGVVSLGTHSGAGNGLGTDPVLWLVALVGLYAFAAPAEELVFRGIVHGRLRGAFGTAGVVTVGALTFGLLHLLSGLLTPSVGVVGALAWVAETIFPGLVWGYAYERTENLLVTSVTHAMTWTQPWAVVLPL